ncbi:MAG: aspartate kinase [Chloroflexi bacterium]|nr:aspartate kinase [Chloroflexota bacterium]MCH2308248.1 aspartate kinase [SAR202 cluster bacterium]MQG04951.1 aspartate kinase [SAR202 cluster bacterium]|tara:strand:- start:15116 stop:16351 length:1236 start_codon:yes stop_codon:yes gene_type:complete
MSLIVQKYGGTSLKNISIIKKVAKKIQSLNLAGTKVVVIVSAMGNTTDSLIKKAHQISKNPSPREMDILLSTGELVSSTLLSIALNSLKIPAISLSGSQAGIQTDINHGKARINSINPKRIFNELKKNKVVIIAGFQGTSLLEETTTLGRGGSDTTAVAIAASLNTDQCEIYTDVDGIFTADPRLVPKAQLLHQIAFEEMLEFASYGAKMDPRAIELAMTYKIPILVKSSTSNSLGSLISEDADMKKTIGEIKNKVRGIATDNNVAKITIRKLKDKPGTSASLFGLLASENVSVEDIVQNSSTGGFTDLSFTLKKPELQQALTILKNSQFNSNISTVETANNLAKISIIGTGMQNTPGYAAKMFRTLGNANINIEMIITSEIRITCIIHESDLQSAAQLLHTEFSLDKNNS